LRGKGLNEADIEKLAPHKVIPGNRPSNTLVVERISPRRLGALVAMYEHKVFVQSVIWGINAFDQWGVELGKELGVGTYQRLIGSLEDNAEDGSTQGLINYFRGRHRG
ncbi:glucose-6-phosphate isomerase, partial [Pseudomonas putida]